MRMRGKCSGAKTCGYLTVLHGNNRSCHLAQNVVVKGDRRVIVTPLATMVTSVPYVILIDARVKRAQTTCIYHDPRHPKLFSVFYFRFSPTV